MKIIIFLFLFLTCLSEVVFGQVDKKDSTDYVIYKDSFGNLKKAMVALPNQILIVDGDSIYTVLNEVQLQMLLGEKSKKFNIINNPDSISLFLRNRIKAVIIRKDKE